MQIQISEVDGDINKLVREFLIVTDMHTRSIENMERSSVCWNLLFNKQHTSIKESFMWYYFTGNNR